MIQTYLLRNICIMKSLTSPLNCEHIKITKFVYDETNKIFWELNHQNSERNFS